MIKLVRSSKTEQIKTDAIEQEEEVVNTLSSTIPNMASTIPTAFTHIFINGDNQGSIA